MVKEKQIVLAQGSEDGYYYRVVSVIRKSGGFHSTALFHIIGRKLSEKGRIRINDRCWFVRHLGKEYMKGKEVHHEWENNAKCFVLDTKEHRRLHHE